ncbi:hypothetical protein CPS_0736 [Colwellia psychrerythraea 34H]|uniref:Uncharacterized protein n=1 Tax=Colwellia psychrerythraea (strain 34H / ATCC BAA-681) TaxID=167879 RepID=Q488M8_COLP3|nr:hypothetical protein CPS_0736 [Colwellia psychrerythraea 34H]
MCLQFKKIKQVHFKTPQQLQFIINYTLPAKLVATFP